jgi:hypothetical protein
MPDLLGEVVGLPASPQLAHQAFDLGAFRFGLLQVPAGVLQVPVAAPPRP